MEAHASLMALLAGIPDPRGAQGQRHPRTALRAVAVVARLAGRTSDEAIVDYGPERGWEFRHLLGVTRKRGRCKVTSSRVFRRIAVADFETRVRPWVEGRLRPGDAPQLPLDGTTARGRRDGETPGVHGVAASAPDVRAVVGQPRVEATTNEPNAARERLGVLPVTGKIRTGDARFTHREVCATVSEGGGDHVLPVQENQPTPRADIAAVVAAPEVGLSPPPDRAARGRWRAGLCGRPGARPDRDADHRGDVVAG